MFHENKDAIYYPENLFLWFLLALQGGFVNVGGFLAVHRFVSHMTGFGTWIGVELAESKYLDTLGMMAVPTFFLIGAMCSAWLIERERMKKRFPKYRIVFSMMIFMFLLIATLGVMSFFGYYGEPFNYRRDYVLLFMLTFVCGLQNAVISSASGAVVRTTHLTGVTTDLGIGLVRLWTDRHHFTKKDNKELFATFFRVGIIASFVSGSIIGAFVFKSFAFWGFYLPAFISFFVMLKLRPKLEPEHLTTNL